MEYLLDTCSFIWLAMIPEKLSAQVQSLINDQGNSFLISDASIWEICLKWKAGKIKLPSPPRMWIFEQRKIWDLRRLVTDIEHYFRVSELPLIHRDPFDRILVAQAMEKNITLLTCDSEIAKYQVAVLW